MTATDSPDWFNTAPVGGGAACLSFSPHILAGSSQSSPVVQCSQFASLSLQMLQDNANQASYTIQFYSDPLGVYGTGQLGLYSKQSNTQTVDVIAVQGAYLAVIIHNYGATAVNPIFSAFGLSEKVVLTDIIRPTMLVIGSNPAVAAGATATFTPPIQASGRMTLWAYCSQAFNVGIYSYYAGSVQIVFRSDFPAGEIQPINFIAPISDWYAEITNFGAVAATGVVTVTGPSA